MKEEGTKALYPTSFNKKKGNSTQRKNKSYEFQGANWARTAWILAQPELYANKPTPKLEPNPNEARTYPTGIVNSLPQEKFRQVELGQLGWSQIPK